jgi:hypothetical protein
MIYTLSPTGKATHNIPVRHIVLAVLVLTIVAYGAHALERHGEYAQRIRQCLEQKPPDIIMHNPFTGRDALCVKMPDGKFGVQIVEEGKEVTSFPNKSGTIEKLLRYLFNAGYVE